MGCRTKLAGPDCPDGLEIIHHPGFAVRFHLLHLSVRQIIAREGINKKTRILLHAKKRKAAEEGMSHQLNNATRI